MFKEFYDASISKEVVDKAWFFYCDLKILEFGIAGGVGSGL